jgi:hypothetical protein
LICRPHWRAGREALIAEGILEVITARLFAKKKPNHRHWYAYDVEFDGELIVQNSRDPEHDLARALLAPRAPRERWSLRCPDRDNEHA